MVLEKTLESPLDCKDINQSILKEISPGISLAGMMLKLKLQYFGHLLRRVDSLEKTLMLGGIGGRHHWESKLVSSDSEFLTARISASLGTKLVEVMEFQLSYSKS